MTANNSTISINKMKKPKTIEEVIKRRREAQLLMWWRGGYALGWRGYIAKKLLESELIK